MTVQGAGVPTLRPAAPDDARAVADVLVEAGVAAWAGFLGEERIRAANAGRSHPADVVAEDGQGVCGFAAWDATTGEVTRLYVHPRRCPRKGARTAVALPPFCCARHQCLISSF